MRGLHEVSTHHGEGNTVAMLGGKLHALLELVLKYGRVETKNTSDFYINLELLFSLYLFHYFLFIFYF